MVAKVLNSSVFESYGIAQQAVSNNKALFLRIFGQTKHETYVTCYIFE